MLSTKILGKESFVLDCFEKIKADSVALFGIDVIVEHYAVGLSDCSYAAVDDAFQGETEYIENTPIWGDLYRIDFSKIRELNIPCMLLGPYGKDYHRITERAELFDVGERVPKLTRRICEYVFSMEFEYQEAIE
jgi:arginine utilization protein RocB